MIEKTTPPTVMTAAASEARMTRAASGAPLTTHDGRVRPPRKAAQSIHTVVTASSTAVNTSAEGTSHRLVRNCSRRCDSPCQIIVHRHDARPTAGVPDHEQDENGSGA